MSTTAAHPATPPKPASQPDTLPRTAAEAVAVFFSHRSPRILLAMVAVLVPLRLALGEFRWVDAAWAIGILLYWPLNEWLIHVYLLHLRPDSRIGRRIDRFVAREHRRHHADPWHLPLVFIPVQAFPVSLALLVLLAWALTPDLYVALSALATYMVFSLHYEWCHYLAHINWCPPLEYYRRRVREHRLHHFRNEKYWWGVSMGMADRVLGTAPDPARVEKSATTATLGAA